LLDDPNPLGHDVTRLGIRAMSNNAAVRARNDEAAKAETAADGAPPFANLLPNAETIETMKSARRGELVTVGKPSALLASLNADC
jgi:hypothetical protein